jgi:hypothetical protein
VSQNVSDTLRPIVNIRKIICDPIIRSGRLVAEDFSLLEQGLDF